MTQTMSLHPGSAMVGVVARSKVFARFGDEPLSNPDTVTTPPSAQSVPPRHPGH